MALGICSTRFAPRSRRFDFDRLAETATIRGRDSPVPPVPYPLCIDPTPVELAKQYDPKAVQPRWISFWQERHLFDANPNPAKKSHTIMIPLANYDDSQHSHDENLLLGSFWNAIETQAALLMME